MPINVISRKFWNQSKNGKLFNENISDFTDYLLGTIGEKIKAEITIDVYWKSKGQQYVDEWSAVISAGTGTVIRQVGSFVDDGFSVGDTIYWTDSVWGTGTGTISAVNDLNMIFTSATGTIDDSLGLHYSMYIWGTTSLTSIIFNFNLIENNSADTFVSAVDGNTIKYAGSGLSATNTLLTSQGTLISWKDDGTVNVKTGTSGIANYQRFIITHEFYITPLYLPTQYDDLGNSIAPSYLKDTSSLKYIAGFELRKSLLNPNISHFTTDSIQNGSVSWFDENYNGFNPIEFTLDSIAYSVYGDVVTELQPDKVTQVDIYLSSASGLFSNTNTPFIVNLFKLPIDESEYKNTLTDMFTNYVFDSCYTKIGVTAVDGYKSIITDCVGVIASGKLHITFNVEYTTAQQLLIDERQYIISVIVDSHTSTHSNSKMVNVLCDYNDYGATADNEDLLISAVTKYYEHPFTPSATNGTKDFKGWITDGIYGQTAIKIDTTALFNYLRYKVVAYNTVTEEEFELMKYDFDLSVYPIVSNERIPSVATTRGFKLISGSLRNLVSLERTSSLNYLLKFALKIKYEDWVKLVGADQDFFNSALLNNGLTNKWSNYSDVVSGWEVKIYQQIILEDLVNGGETTFNLTSDLRCYDYDKDNTLTPKITSALETFNGATSLGTGTNAVVLKTADTKVVVTFTASGGFNDTNKIYGIIYVGGYQTDGIYTQWQLSTEELPAVDNWLKPLSGQTKCKLTVIDANHVKLECLIDYTKINGDLTIWGRIGNKCEPLSEVKAHAHFSITIAEYNAIHTSYWYSLYKNGVAVIEHHLYPAPYGFSAFRDDLYLETGYYISNPVKNMSTGKYDLIILAPEGEGSSANGDVILIKTEMYMHPTFMMKFSKSVTLGDGVDGYVCGEFVGESAYLLQENGSYLLQENGDRIIL